jgi:VanZ family protein
MSRPGTSSLRHPATEHLRSWLPALLWACAIFFFSTDLFSSDNTAIVVGSLFGMLIPGLTGHDVELFHGLVRKLGHFTEYFIFTVLLARALRKENRGALSMRHYLISLAVAILYAVSDEFHQTFVPSRSATVVDVWIDTCGGIAGILWSHLRNRGKKSAWRNEEGRIPDRLPP